MIRVFIFGILGSIGKELALQIEKSSDFCLVGGFDKSDAKASDFDPAHLHLLSIPVYDKIDEVAVDFDIIFDFSSPQACADIIYIAQKRKVPLVIATSGHSQKQQEKLRSLANLMPVFMSPNLSLGLGAIISVLPCLLNELGEDFDIEILEQLPRDEESPSQTTLMIFDKLSRQRDFTPVFGRSQKSTKRCDEDIGIHSLRCGSGYTEYEIVLSSQNETITIRHQTHSKTACALGALRAAEFILNKKKGFYTGIE